MAERNIDDLEHLDGSAPVATAPPPVARPAELKEVLVEINYPDPTSLSIIIRDVSRWSGQSFVMEPSVNAKIQIFAPRRLNTGDAYELFLASLSVVGLRAVQLGRIVKIVPVTLVVSA